MMGSQTTRELASPRAAKAAAEQSELAVLARGAAGSASRLARNLLLSQVRSIGQAQRDAAFVAGMAEWPLLLSRMGEVEERAPNAVNVGYEADAGLMDIADAVRPGPARPATVGETAAFLLDVAETLAIAADPTTARHDVRWALEDAFAAWPKVCRRMPAFMAAFMAQTRTS